MDSDRELLEKAAKAAGIELVGPVEKYIVQFDERHKGGFIVNNQRGGQSAWNPLTDDGDALRLAVTLGIADLGNFFGGDEADPYAATRRAIVRAAAAMGDKDA